MKELHEYEVRAVNPKTGQRHFLAVEAVSERQAWYLFCKMKNGFYYQGFDIRDMGPVDGGSPQIPLF